MDLGEVDLGHVFRRVIVANLSSSPIDALDLDGLAILDLAKAWDLTVSAKDVGSGEGSRSYCLGAIGSIELRVSHWGHPSRSMSSRVASRTYMQVR